MYWNLIKEIIGIGLEENQVSVLGSGDSQPLSRYQNMHYTFSKSEIVNGFKMRWTKLIYINNFGLVSDFKELVYSKIKAAKWSGILFDELVSLKNKITRLVKGTFALYFWTKKKDSVDVHCLPSTFLGHSSSSDILQFFLGNIH